jgi:hypothetical protein
MLMKKTLSFFLLAIFLCIASCGIRSDYVPDPDYLSIDSKSFYIDIDLTNVTGNYNSVSASSDTPLTLIASFQSNFTEDQKQSKEWITLDGSIQVNINYEDLQEGEEYMLLVYFKDSNGLQGLTRSSDYIPVKIYRASDNINETLDSDEYTLKSWDGDDGPINQNLTYYLKIKIADLPQQQYKGKLVFVFAIDNTL